MILTLGANDSGKRIYDNSIVGNTSYSLVKKCKHVCVDEIRINGAKLNSKYKKRERNAKV